MILYVNINFKGNYHNIKTKRHTFSLVSDNDVEKMKNENFFSKFFNLSQFHKDIFTSSRSQMFIKIGFLKNFAICWIKKRLQHRCFPEHTAKFLKVSIGIHLYSPAYNSNCSKYVRNCCNVYLLIKLLKMSG